MKHWEGPDWKRPWFVLPKWVVISSAIVVAGAAAYVLCVLWMCL